PRGFHPGLSLRDKLQTPRQDYSRRFHSLVVLPAPPAIGQWLLLYDLVESTPFPECYAPPRSQVLTPRICDNESSLRPLVLFSAEPSRDCHEPARFQDADLWLLVDWKSHHPVVLCPKK